MRKKTIRFIPCSPHDVDATVAWLEAQAMAGRRFCKSFWLWIAFEKTEPQKIKYVVRKSKTAKNGLTYIGRLACLYHLFSADDSEKSYQNQYSKGYFALIPICAFFMELLVLATILQRYGLNNMEYMQKVWTWWTVFYCVAVIFFLLLSVHYLPCLFQQVRGRHFGLKGKVKNALLLLSMLLCVALACVAKIAPMTPYEEAPAVIHTEAGPAYVKEEYIPLGKYLQYCETNEKTHSVWVYEYRFVSSGIARYLFKCYEGDFEQRLEWHEQKIKQELSQNIEPTEELNAFDPKIRVVWMSDQRFWLIQTGKSLIYVKSVVPLSIEEILCWLQSSYCCNTGDGSICCPITLTLILPHGWLCAWQ